MRINNNISAMNTYSRLTSAQGAQSKSLEKLSSGLRINRAGDDAAGLAISEKMRGQIKGLNQSVRNAQDGISLIQTAEGALNETHSILNRMRELAVQSSNDTNTNDDRVEIQKEMDQLATEITRISSDTEFNTQKLLNGNFDAKFHIGSNSNQNMRLEVSNMSSDALGVNSFEAQNLIADKISLTSSSGKEISIAFATAPAVTVETAIGEDAVLSEDGATLTITLGRDASADNVVGDINTTYSSLVDLINSKSAGVTASIAEGVDGTGAAIGADAKTAATLETVGEWTRAGNNVSTQEAANAAISTIDDAITAVSAERSKLGAVQNRLDHTINNLTTTSENLSAAESRIRDVDMAKEMMEFTKNNILNQASTAMLAQANQMPQGVLQLLG